MKDILDQFRLGRHEFENGHIEGFQGINPYELFELWMTEAVNSGELEPNAFVLSTSSKSNQPSSRIVYLKDILEGSFILYTNYSSHKGLEIADNPRVSMLFFWPKSSRQIRIEGICTKADESVSDAYFESRPRASKIGAWASDQSSELKDREELEERVKHFDSKFEGAVPRPDFWGGYSIKPTEFEFWQGRPSRLHDRLVFISENEAWKVLKKNP